MAKASFAISFHLLYVFVARRGEAAAGAKCHGVALKAVIIAHRVLRYGGDTRVFQKMCI